MRNQFGQLAEIMQSNVGRRQGIVGRCAVYPSANTANARIDFRLDFLAGAVDSGCPVWLCSTDVWVTCINLNE